MTSKHSKDAFRSRERALENEFFMEVDRKLLTQLKAKMDADEQIRQLAEYTGFDDESLLDELVELGVSVESLTAMSIIPMVLAAWADSRVDSLERHAILKAAAEAGIEPDMPAGQILTGWLNNRPTQKLKETWKHYLHAVLPNLTEKGRKAMKAEILKRSRSVARVSGGPLGFGVMTADEKRIITELEEAFEVEPKNGP